MNEKTFIKELTRYKEKPQDNDFKKKHKALLKCINDKKISEYDFIDIVRIFYCEHEIIGDNKCLRCQTENILKL